MGLSDPASSEVRWYQITPVVVRALPNGKFQVSGVALLFPDEPSEVSAEELIPLILRKSVVNPEITWEPSHQREFKPKKVARVKETVSLESLGITFNL